MAGATGGPCSGLMETLAGGGIREGFLGKSQWKEDLVFAGKELGEQRSISDDRKLAKIQMHGMTRVGISKQVGITRAVVLNQGGVHSHAGTFGPVWKHFRLLHLSGVSTGIYNRSQGCYQTSLNAQNTSMHRR